MTQRQRYRYVFKASADRHGVTHERARHVVEHCGYEHYGLGTTAMGTDTVFCFGDDRAGNRLEVGLIFGKGNEVTIIHAKRLSPKYRRYYDEAVPFRR